MMQAINAVKAAQALLKDPLQKAKCIVDATAGNGGDTLFLASHCPEDAMVYAFDIQEAALEETKRRTAAFCRKIRYILDSHARVKAYVQEEIDVAVFNLGYLPGGDHSVVTSADTTLAALDSILASLRVNGIAALTVYPGHEAGGEEYRRLAAFVRGLSMRTFTAGLYKMVNHGEKAPVLYIIEKVRL